MTPRWGVALAVSSIMLAFAGNSAITRYIIGGGLASPFMLTTVRFTSGLGTLLLIRLSFPSMFPRSFRRRHDVVGGIFLGAYAFSISFGYLFISAAAGTLVFYAFVVLTMALFGVLHDGDRPTRHSVAGQFLAVAGVGVITVGGIRDVTVPGILLMAATGASWGLYSVHGRAGGDARAYTLNTFLVVGVFALAAMPAVGLVDVGGLRIEPTWNGLGLALFMGMISTALSYILWHLMLRRITSSAGGIVQLLVPVLASGMGILVLAEHLTVTLALGGALVLAGIYLNRVRPGNATAMGPH